MNPLSRMLMGFLAFGTLPPRKPSWRQPRVSDAGRVTRQQMRALLRQQPDMAVALQLVAAERA
jgi:hypothetical protein